MGIFEEMNKSIQDIGRINLIVAKGEEIYDEVEKGKITKEEGIEILEEYRRTL